MKWQAAIVVVVAALLVASPGKAEKVRPVAESEFGKLLQGCWSSESHALLDVGEFSDDQTVCFEQDGHLSLDDSGYGPKGEYSSNGEGAYWFASERLYLDNSGPTEAWPFGHNRVHCNAVVRLDDDTLELTNCLEDDTGIESGGFYFGRLSRDE